MLLNQVKVYLPSSMTILDISLSHLFNPQAPPLRPSPPPAPTTYLPPTSSHQPPPHTTHTSQTPAITPTGPIQLWQFILELLSDKNCQHFISWTGDGWEYKMTDPDEVRETTKMLRSIFFNTKVLEINSPCPRLRGDGERGKTSRR